jgi:hypothetical protein
MGKLKIQLTDGTIEVTVPETVVQELDRQIRELWQKYQFPLTHKIPPWEYQHQGEIFLEVFGNLNSWANPMSAKILLTIRTDRLRLIYELPLTQFRQDLQDYSSHG